LLFKGLKPVDKSTKLLIAKAHRLWITCGQIVNNLWMMSDYHHPTKEEWRRAVRRVRKMRAEKRGLAALAAMRRLLAAHPDVPHETIDHVTERDTGRLA